MKLWRTLMVSFLLSVTGTALAGELSYTCQVRHIYSLSQSGILETSNWEKEMKESSFTVSRITGEIVGEVLPTSLAKSTRVINKGSANNSFKAVAEFEGQVQILEVQEFSTSPTKPFIALSMGGAGLITGTCK